GIPLIAFQARNSQGSLSFSEPIAFPSEYMRQNFSGDLGSISKGRLPRETSSDACPRSRRASFFGKASRVFAETQRSTSRHCAFHQPRSKKITALKWLL